MANRHFGKISDVWKHAVLAEVLEREPPGCYAETHAGSGAYAVVHDREREFGGTVVSMEAPAARSGRPAG